MASAALTTGAAPVDPEQTSQASARARCNLALCFLGQRTARANPALYLALMALALDLATISSRANYAAVKLSDAGGTSVLLSQDTSLFKNPQSSELIKRPYCDHAAPVL